MTLNFTIARYCNFFYLHVKHHTVVVAEQDDAILRQTLPQKFIAAHVLPHSMAHVKHGTAHRGMSADHEGSSSALPPPPTYRGTSRGVHSRTCSLSPFHTLANSGARCSSCTATPAVSSAIDARAGSTFRQLADCAHRLGARVTRGRLKPKLSKKFNYVQHKLCT